MASPLPFRRKPTNTPVLMAERSALTNADVGGLSLNSMDCVSPLRS